MRRLLLSLSAVALVSGFIAAPIASAQQSVNFYIGGFTPRALDARPDDDVLVQNGTFLSTLNQLGIDIGEFNDVTVGGEWLFALGRRLEGGLGLGFYQRTCRRCTPISSTSNGTDIEQTSSCESCRSLPRYGCCHSGTINPSSRTSARASACTAGATAKPVSSSYPGNDIFTGNFVGKRQRRPVRRSSAASACRSDLRRRLRNPASVGRGDRPGGRDCSPGEDRSRRVQLSLHDELQVLRKALPQRTRREHGAHCILSGPPFVPVTSVVALVLWYSARPAPSHTREYPSRKRGCSRARIASMSPPSAFSSISTHSANGRGPCRAPPARCRRCLRAENRADRNPARDVSCM